MLSKSSIQPAKHQNRRHFLKNSFVLASGTVLASDALALGTTASLKHGQPPRPVCVFTKSLQYLAYDELGRTLARTGYDGADLSVRPGGHVEPENVKVDLPKLVKALQQNGVSAPMMVTAITDPTDKHAETVIGTAADLGITHYRMGYVNYDTNKSIPGNLSDVKRKFEQLEKINRKHNIHGEYQNHAGTQVGGPVWDLYLLLKDLDPQHIGIQYDIRHATCEGGQSWPLGLELLAPWIKTCAIKDFVWQRRLKKWIPYDVPLGEGMVDFDAFFKTYKRLNLSGPFSIHLEYELGGAEHGNRNPNIEAEEVVTYLRRDNTWLRNKLKEHDLG